MIGETKYAYSIVGSSIIKDGDTGTTWVEGIAILDEDETEVKFKGIFMTDIEEMWERIHKQIEREFDKAKEVDECSGTD